MLREWEGLVTSTASSHQGAIFIFWLHFSVEIPPNGGTWRDQPLAFLLAAESRTDGPSNMALVLATGRNIPDGGGGGGLKEARLEFL